MSAMEIGRSAWRNDLINIEVRSTRVPDGDQTILPLMNSWVNEIIKIVLLLRQTAGSFMSSCEEMLSVE